MPIHYHMGDEFHAIFQHHIGANDAARANLATRADLC
jgi:hypothetical protein